MLTFVLLVWLWMRQRARVRYLDAEPVSALRGFAVLGLGLLALQVVLGGWTSTNYAALACTDLPTCHGQWWPQVEFGEAFQILRPLGQTRDGQMLPAQALTAIHLAHRIGAVIVGGYLLWLGLRVAKTPGVRAIGAAMLALLALQIALGLSNVLLSLPLPVAVAHNGVAALLLASLVVLNFRVSNARLQI
jgi:cytochrome c oxidase assembly protein subunit 15